MSENNKPEVDRKASYTGIGMATGLVFGGLVGYLIGNPIIFSGGGLVLGLALGRLYDRRKQS